jgi:hypothetical protein
LAKRWRRWSAPADRAEGKKDVAGGTSFRGLLAELGVDKNRAMDAQRVACLPFAELEKFCAIARRRGEAPTFDGLLT